MVFKRNVPKKRGKLRVEVTSEKGTVVYRGADRRRHNEQVFFDSAFGNRRFTLPKYGKSRISKKRLQALTKMSGTGKFLGQPSYLSTRSTKHKEKRF